jgi:hypothetical protein
MREEHKKKKKKEKKERRYSLCSMVGYQRETLPMNLNK